MVDADGVSFAGGKAASAADFAIAPVEMIRSRV
jgi:hypothetical protein